MSGILFLFTLAAPASEIELASGLFAEGDWIACRRECERVLRESPDHEAALLLDSVSRLRLNTDKARACTVLDALAKSATSVNNRATAAYELGRVKWQEGDAGTAFQLLRQAFLETTSPDLFLRAGCSIDRLVRSFPALAGKPNIGKNDPVLFQTLETSRVLWTSQIVKECSLEPGKGRSALSKPGQWIVAFYRGQVRPAIGARCSLEPNCSEYFREACRKHGLLGFPIQADRFFREPSVVQAAAHPIPTVEGMHYADPLSDHDWWLKGEAR